MTRARAAVTTIARLSPPRPPASFPARIESTEPTFFRRRLRGGGSHRHAAAAQAGSERSVCPRPPPRPLRAAERIRAPPRRGANPRPSGTRTHLAALASSRGLLGSRPMSGRGRTSGCVGAGGGWGLVASRVGWRAGSAYGLAGWLARWDVWQGGPKGMDL